MDLQTLFNGLMGIFGTGATFVLKLFADRLKEARDEAANALREVNNHKLHVSEYYIHIRRFEGFETALFKKLDQIEEKLDRKADKA